MENNIKGLVAIFTGNGKGKTSASLGVILRSLGHGRKCKLIQFIKGRLKTGEMYMVDALSPNLEIVRTGKGFTWDKDITREEHIQAAAEGLKIAMETVKSGVYETIVLDEILYALRSGLVSIEQIEEIIDAKPKLVHLVLTGRDAPQRLIDKADLVTSMEMIKHPKSAGIPAQEGMDF